jgi:predicted HAD superfamily Cof-like phosphohydrolase
MGIKENKMKNVTLGSIAEDHFRDVTEMVSIRSGADVVGAIEEVVENFMYEAGQTTETYNTRQIALYTGLQLEEMAEKLFAIGLKHDSNLLDGLGHDFKMGLHDRFVEKADKEALLDADVDLAWVTLGSMYSQGADVIGAIDEVARANLEKVGPDSTTDSNGKIIKPEGWEPPNLEPFIYKMS